MNRILISVMFLVALVGAGVIYQRGEGKGVVDWAIAAVTETEHRVAALLSAQTKEAGPAAARPQPSIPVVATAVIRKPAAVRLEAIGTVQTIASVIVKSRIDGQIVKVHIRDGQ